MLVPACWYIFMRRIIAAEFSLRDFADVSMKRSVSTNGLPGFVIRIRMSKISTIGPEPVLLDLPEYAVSQRISASATIAISLIECCCSCPRRESADQCISNDCDRSTQLELDLLSGRYSKFLTYLSISPITMSVEPMMAGKSPIRQPRQISPITLKLEKLEERARTRNGTFSLFGRPTT